MVRPRVALTQSRDGTIQSALMTNRSKLLSTACLAGLVALSFGAGACGGADQDSAAGGSGPGQLGAHHVARFEIVTPDELGEGSNELQLRVTDGETGAAIDGASITGRQFMPAMGHDRELGYVDEGGSGTYRISDVVFDMPGSWMVRVRLEKGALFDEAELPVEIP